MNHEPIAHVLALRDVIEIVFSNLPSKCLFFLVSPVPQLCFLPMCTPLAADTLQRPSSPVRPVLCMNAFNERSFMNLFIFWANVNWTHVFLSDEWFCERVHSGVCERRVLTVWLRSRQCQISMEPSRQKPVKTHSEKDLICSRKYPVWLLCIKRKLDKRFVQLTLLSIKTKLNYFRQKQLHT